MSALKDQDPDYGPSDASSQRHQRIYEENARSSTARKITTIIEREFSQEINLKEKEVLEIQEKLHRASKILHLLRYVIVADFYNRKQCHNLQNGDVKQTQIHPAIKQLIGKTPRPFENSSYSTPIIPTSNENYLTKSQTVSTALFNFVDCSLIKTEKLKETSELSRLEKRSNDGKDETQPKKIPRYIPPRSGVPEPQCPSRGIRHKIRKRVIIGNISKWIPPEWREDAASHKWTMYVRGNKDNPNIDDFVSKVRFFLHPSYRPNDVVEVTAAPFCLSRRGWGEFPLRVQLHFKSVLNKPMDIIHHLKLDRTYTGLQTLGSETLVDIWIHGDSRTSNRSMSKVINQNLLASESNCKLKQENNEGLVSTSNFSYNSLNETLKLKDVNCDMIIKQELSDDIKTKNDSITIRKLQFYVELDHDYCGSKYLNGSGGNLTIDHTSTVFTLSDTTEKEIFRNHSVNTQTNSHRMIELSRNTSRVLPLSCSSVHSSLRPLEISIPPLFEPSRNKHVLILQNNKTVPVGITATRVDDHSRNMYNEPAKTKINLTTSRGISLLKKSQNSEAQKLQLSKSILLNVNSNVPVLKIAEKIRSSDDVSSNSEIHVAPEQKSRLSYQETREHKLLRQKITLGKDKHKLNSKKEFYDAELRTIKIVNIQNIEGLLRFIIKRMPMITPNASDPDYKRLHPYACGSIAEFLSYNVAKRNACEWYRAKMIRQFMKKKSFPEEELWSIKEIMIWARLHGYKPLCADFVIRSGRNKKCLPDSVTTKNISTCTENDSFCKWLQICPTRSNDELFDCNINQCNEFNTDIDVLNIDAAVLNRKKTVNEEECKQTINVNITVLELENKLVPLHDFVCETTREIGIKLFSEEIIPNAVHCAASRMIMRAVECLVEDLVRMSLAKAWERCNDNSYPKVIVLDDVRAALLNREEFDIFTNRGLGSKYRFTSAE